MIANNRQAHNPSLQPGHAESTPHQPRTNPSALQCAQGPQPPPRLATAVRQSYLANARTNISSPYAARLRGSPLRAHTTRRAQPSFARRCRIGERAEAIRGQFDERHVTTEEARQQLELLAEETIAAEQAQKDTGLDDLTFTLYWELKRQIYKDPKPLAIALVDPFKRFPNFHANPDEMRELKAQLYKLLLPSVQGKKMVEVADRLIKVRTP